MRSLWRLSGRIVMGVLVVAGALLLVLVALALVPRLQSESRADRAAAAMLAAGEIEPVRPNALPALMALEYVRSPDPAAYRPPARTAGTVPSPVPCALRQEDCLAQVRHAPAAAAAAVDQAQPALDRFDGLPADAVAWQPPPRQPLLTAGPKQQLADLYLLPTPDLGPLQRALLTRAALSAVRGEAAGGMAQACMAALQWRALRRGSNDAVIDSAGLTFTGQALQLMAQIAATQPAGTPLPAVCAAALAPLSDDALSLCPVAARRAQGARAMMVFLQRLVHSRMHWTDPAGVLAGLMTVDARRAAWRIDRATAWACRPDVPQRLRAGTLTPPRAETGSGLSCMGDLAGCAAAARYAGPAATAGAIARRRALLIQLAALAQWQWLRTHAAAVDADWGSAYARLPAGLHDPAVQLDASGHALVATLPPLYAAEPLDAALPAMSPPPRTWRLPLPPQALASGAQAP